MQRREVHLEVFQQNVREVGPLDEPAVWDNLSLQPLDHTAPQLIAVGRVAHHCRAGCNQVNSSINNPDDKTIHLMLESYIACCLWFDPCTALATSACPSSQCAFDETMMHSKGTATLFLQTNSASPSTHNNPRTPKL